MKRITTAYLKKNLIASKLHYAKEKNKKLEGVSGGQDVRE